jgi:hypothetical protein
MSFDAKPVINGGISVGTGLCAVPHLLNPFTTMRNATEGVPYRFFQRF